MPKNTIKLIDFKSVSYAEEALARKQDKPFFLACGIFKPHSPFFAPPKYHALYDDDLAMPLLKKDDWDDLPEGAAKLMKAKKWFWTGILKLIKVIRIRMIFLEFPVEIFHSRCAVMCSNEINHYIWQLVFFCQFNPVVDV